MNTRERIIDQSIELFNEKGYEFITLTDIAEKIGMSRGNLAYHFKDKDLILHEVAQRIQSEIDLAMKSRKDFPAFSNLQVDIKSYHQLQISYQFVFANRSVLENKAIREVMQQWSDRTIQNNMEAFAFAVEKGNMEPEPFPGVYHNLAVNTWMIIYFWLSQKDVRNDRSTDDAERMVWSTIIPHFTKKGIKAFEKYFGGAFLKDLGPSFQQLSNNIWSF